MTSDQNKQMYRLVFEHSMDAVLYTASDGRILAANPAACSLFQYSEVEICALGRNGLIDVHDSPQFATMMEERHRTGKTQGEIAFVRGDGRRLIGWFNSSRFSDDSGDVRVVTIIRDLTQIKEKEFAMNESLRELNDLYDNAPCGYHSVNSDGLIIKINRAELAWLGYELDEILGRHLGDIYSSASQRVILKKLNHLRHHEPVRDLEVDLLRKDGTLLPVLLNATAVYDDDGNFIMSRSTVVDLTQRKEFETELKRQACTDFLTGLENRRNFTKLARREFAVSKRLISTLGCLIIDIDWFKNVNDTYGHDVGDVVLRAAAGCCRKTLREVDIVGRWGGEEFTVLLVGLGQNKITTIAERLRIALSKVKVDVGNDRTVSFTVSIGGSSMASSDLSIESVMKRADIALYRAKKAGRNCVKLDT